MAENSKIEWTDHTFNPWIGCTKVGPGCDHCYAERMDARFQGGHWGPGAPRRRTKDANWNTVRKLNRRAAAAGVRQRVFVASLADWADNEVPESWRADLWALIDECRSLDFLLLTKRIGRVAALLPWSEGERPWPHVWIGATVVNQDEADRDVRKLLAVPAAVRFLSMEPLLGPVKLPRVDFHCDLCGGTGTLARWPKGRCHHCGGRGVIPAISTDPKFGTPATPMRGIDWVIVGGESGPGARVMEAAWARDLRDQCTSAGVPFFFKQWGEHGPNWYNDDHGVKIPGTEWMDRQGKRLAGRTLDGRTWDQIPAAPAGVTHAEG